MKIEDLPTPAFVINRHAFRKNCTKAIETAKAKNMKLRPHIKTHKTVQGCQLQVGDAGCAVTGFVASTIPEVAMLVQAAQEHNGPFCNILYGVPISQCKLPAIEGLRQSGCTIHVIIDHPQQVSFIHDFITSLEKPILPLSAFVKLDTGYHRAGITCDERGVDLIRTIIQSPFICLYGLYSHCGHAYNENDIVNLDVIAQTDLQQINNFLELLKGAGIETDDLAISIGSTPSLFHHSNHLHLPNVEVHPGNYTLYDRQQLWTKACDRNDVAGRVISRVIGHYEDRNTILLDAGATALTKEQTPQGGMCEIGGAPELQCLRMSQEVTVVSDPTQDTFPFHSYPLGSIVNLIPNHSCLAAACFSKYYIIDDPTCTFEKDQEIVDEWIPSKFFS